MEQVSIEQLKREEIRETARVLALAFSSRPGLIKMLKGQRDKERRAVAHFEFELKHLPGNVLVARKDSRVVGAIRFVQWPHCQLSPLQTLRYLPTMLVEMRSTALPHARQSLTWYRLDPKQPHWHIDPIAVLPEMHRQGIGSQLMTRFCKQMDENGEKHIWKQTNRNMCGSTSVLASRSLRKLTLKVGTSGSCGATLGRGEGTSPWARQPRPYWVGWSTCSN